MIRSPGLRALAPPCRRHQHPVSYLISGRIDLLLDTADGFVIIDHKASPQARSDWQEVALKYSGQLEAYAKGVRRATGKPVLGKWSHFGVTGGLVSLQAMSP